MCNFSLRSDIFADVSAGVSADVFTKICSRPSRCVYQNGEIPKTNSENVDKASLGAFDAIKNILNKAWEYMKPGDVKAGEREDNENDNRTPDEILANIESLTNELAGFDDHKEFQGFIEAYKNMAEKKGSLGGFGSIVKNANSVEGSFNQVLRTVEEQVVLYKELAKDPASTVQSQEQRTEIANQIKDIKKKLESDSSTI